MDLFTYQQLALRTAKDLETPLAELQHALLGLTSETGELADVVKKHVIYGRDLDKENIAEELGDILWYLAIGAESVGTTLEEIANANIAKLKTRYPEKYSDKLAAERLDKVDTPSGSEPQLHTEDPDN
jgi:NTP pyrophosphatase (non-canonical NTP hydrolase)